MYKNTTARKRVKFWAFKQWSIQRKLPVLIFLLLLAVIVAFSWLSFRGIRKSSLEAGRVRLHTLADQLSTMFSQSAQSLVGITRTEANKAAVKAYLKSGGEDSVSQTMAILQKLRIDSTWVLVELLNREKKVVLRSGDNLDKNGETMNPLGLKTKLKIDTGIVGKIYVTNDKLYYPIELAVLDGRETVGYLVRWRRLQTTQQAIDRFRQLLGVGVNLYVGNKDGSLWTDLKKQVTLPPAAFDTVAALTGYNREGAGFFSATTPIKHTGWKVLIELPRQEVEKPAFRFLGIALSTGIILLAVGTFLTWLLSRSITRPLIKLTAATSSMAAGNYTNRVNLKSRDELGELATSFNTMAEQVELSKKSLETKVAERTAQLQTANKELEAFSYSVSHDLRAPLRAISGYTGILKEDYGSGLDAEGNRLLNEVVRHATMMGQLIDDLIGFARISRKESNYQMVNMKKMAEACYHELLQQYPGSNARVEIMELPACYTDENLIHQVWINLISNALKYSSKVTAPFIEIGFKQESIQTIYYVRDNGAGFDMKYADKLFAVFQRLHRHDEFEGTGVGLALAERIITKQDGKIWAEAAVGEGATFYFSLPIQNKQ